MKNVLKKIKANIKIALWKTNFYRRLFISGAGPRIFYLMGLGDRFPNLGDQAQAAAIPIWMKKHFHMPVIEIKNYEVKSCLPLLKKHINKNDIVFLHSGGNFGDDWYTTQLMRESIISSLIGNRIIQLPQTIFYSDTESGNLASVRSKEVINKHISLLIFGRDFQSTEIAKKLFCNTPILSRPDMVLSLQETVENQLSKEVSRRTQNFKRILLIMRNDKEGIYGLDDKNDIAKILSNAGYEPRLWDTDVNDSFPNQDKFKTLTKYLKFISEFDAVITDRYHGLIFSVLVKRPCVVLKTHNHKLTSAFDWFDNVNYVKRVNSTDDLVAALTEMQGFHEYVSPRWSDIHFDPMAIEVKNFLANSVIGER
ncbi:polysaccharide pyruvyl transferase family protein [Methylotenera sp.]|uniref:polysaccharide pyruvyl transferase family protein n=1 Tax=Methylotenera sp. TaxID=2051956 RepID=UPI00271BD983|nr:polysaccharide pyruvyl transferase family protein [Methylotenera sp.]MDO9204590.1 polysaccharide pyruvyl transferase family protein [Methylotenera sp.]MDP2071280.1 polysaccharide pyruvyl transferase family protein [Methylotenera sp.]MDP3005197.1 polysaccharide pyruvyl transferase family protein [Methylotenera sp.]MDP3818099.1 polysaccharide pyruvyl transferase family protein [Methylotenera sp.]